ncbi:MAG: glutathione S-transferase family protein [Haliea sp.]
MKLWHCTSARSLRPLWTLEEASLDYELEILPFPPRTLRPDYLKTNCLGTVPYFVDGAVKMTESVAICHYLVDRYSVPDIGVGPGEREYGQYLNWLHHADSTLTFPQTLVLRYRDLEPDVNKQAVAEDYSRWFISRLKLVDRTLQYSDYLVAGRFTIADIVVTYALILGRILGLDQYYQPQTRKYMERLMQRPAFKRANSLGEPLTLPSTQP